MNKRNEYDLYFRELYKEFVKYNFVGTLEDRCLIEEIEIHIYKEFPISVEEIVNLNHQILDYCIKNDIKTFKGFAELITKSKLVKTRCSIPLQQLWQKAKMEAKEWKEINCQLDNID